MGFDLEYPRVFMRLMDSVGRGAGLNGMKLMEQVKQLEGICPFVQPININ